MFVENNSQQSESVLFSPVKRKLCFFKKIFEKEVTSKIIATFFVH